MGRQQSREDSVRDCYCPWFLRGTPAFLDLWRETSIKEIVLIRFFRTQNPELKKNNGQPGDNVKQKPKPHSRTIKAPHLNRTKRDGSARSKMRTMTASITSCMFLKATIGRLKTNKIGMAAQTFSSYTKAYANACTRGHPVMCLIMFLLFLFLLLSLALGVVVSTNFWAKFEYILRASLRNSSK